jgi:hypothetical protein
MHKALGWGVHPPNSLQPPKSHTKHLHTIYSQPQIKHKAWLKVLGASLFLSTCVSPCHGLGKPASINRSPHCRVRASLGTKPPRTFSITSHTRCCFASISLQPPASMDARNNNAVVGLWITSYPTQPPQIKSSKDWFHSSGRSMRRGRTGAQGGSLSRAALVHSCLMHQNQTNRHNTHTATSA